MFEPGDVISHRQMCDAEKFNLQRGMNFRANGRYSIILMSQKDNAPYADKILNEGKILIYEGHDVPKNQAPFPKQVDQVSRTKSGLTQNGKFEKAANLYIKGQRPAELVKVYEKILDGIWVYNGMFELRGVYKKLVDGRNVFKFLLVSTSEVVEQDNKKKNVLGDIDHNRIIPTDVKLEVWKRDRGMCVKCGSNTNPFRPHLTLFKRWNIFKGRKYSVALCKA